MQFYNPTLEDFKWQCNGRVYDFHKRTVVEVDDNVVPFIEEQCAHKGLFALRYGIDFKAAERQALLRYLKETLEARIQNFKDWKLQMKMTRNIDLDDPAEMRRAQRWRQELIAMLESQAPIEVELSYLDEEARKKAGVSDTKNVVHFTDRPKLEAKKIFAGFDQAQIETGFDVPASSDSYLKEAAEALPNGKVEESIKEDPFKRTRKQA